VKLPLLVSVPHAGLSVPPDLEEYNTLTPEQIVEDGDAGAREIFAVAADVSAFVTTDIARAFVDMNRPEDDCSPDGVVKTETIYQVPIYRRPLPDELIELLLERYYRPYHQRLSRLAKSAVLGIDCHTMAATAPPISPDAGTPRPPLCLSNGDGTCSVEAMNLVAECLAESFGCEASINRPFKGGHIIRSHAPELPWMQLEISRGDFMSIGEKRSCFGDALDIWRRRSQ
jgi:formiminoglutamase